eukprot:m.187668 g.187668  ORF g.187668 m.187668 type:complete len:204 (-) comp17155_c0_seq1:28-639(-)
MGDEVVARATATELATRFKTEGNGYFKQKHMLAAIDSYTKAIEAIREYPGIDSPDCDRNVKELTSVLYANRAAAGLGYGEDHTARAELFFNLGVSDDFVAQSVWASEVLRRLDKAETDARTAISMNEANAKAHFRLGMALLELTEKDYDGTNRIERLRGAEKAFERSNALQESAATRAKAELAAKRAEEEEAMAKVEPVASST